MKIFRFKMLFFVSLLALQALALEDSKPLPYTASAFAYFKMEQLSRQIGWKNILAKHSDSLRIGLYQNSAGLPYLFYPNPQSTGELVVFIPGFKASLSDSQNAFFLYNIANRGADVLIFPNPWSHDYLKAEAVTFPGMLPQEARSYYLSISQVLIKLRNQRLINSVHLVGNSYGALLAAAIKNYENTHQAQNSFIKKLTLLSPPLDLLATQRYVDSLYAACEDLQYAAPAAHATELLELLQNTKKVGDLSSKVTPQQDFATMLMFYRWVFFEAMHNVGRAIVDAGEKTNSYWAFLRDRRFQYRWAGDVAKQPQTFAEYSVLIQNLSPTKEHPYSNPNEARLLYYIDQIQAAGFKDYSIVSAVDDIVNTDTLQNIPLASWTTQRAEVLVPNVNFFLLDRYSHNGYFQTPWFENYLTERFGARKPQAVLPILKKEEDLVAPKLLKFLKN